MKAFIAASMLLVSASALADSFACTLRVGNSYSTVHESEYRSRTVKVNVGDFTCDGTFKNNVMRAIVYQPILHNDQDILEAIGDAHGVRLESVVDDVTCSCSLM